MSPSLLPRMEHELPDLPELPASLKALLFILMAFGFGITILVYLVNLCSHTSAKEQKPHHPRPKPCRRNHGKPQSWKNILPRWIPGSRRHNSNRKPIDKPSKYASVPSASPSSSSTSGMERAPLRHISPHSFPSTTPPDTDSPYNPYIPPPPPHHERRTSSQWAAEREAFLNPSKSRTSSPASTTTRADFEDIEALERPLVPPPYSNERVLLPQKVQQAWKRFGKR
ncbi:hypothetical protein P154DRAFT_526745 [Amniculicola lignicola CBS 123094]|uniref:Uncharacterized protein n=1 Tax=Amniculicola lignicola CBS 123094 TaxID=1392246 RepID=A0A6A5W0W1_9PLEO|nr:hypothetical protein P154DRAFT_526745 [Amniculicola lignicola CBS 123094]